MALSIAKGLNKEMTSVVLHNGSLVCQQYLDSGCVFEKFSLNNIRKYHNEACIFLSHHRKTTTYLILISKILFFNKLRIIHVAHTTFSSLRYFTLFPKYNIAVSKTVRKNMMSFFHIKGEDIQVIYNGLNDYYNCSEEATSRINENTINILFLGRIDPVKRQVEFVEKTKGRIDRTIKIYFGGEGKDSENLRIIINNDPQYTMLGLIDVYKELYKYDYVCLFSEKEGLPLSLIQGEMFHRPLITNDIPQCLEINSDGYSGFVCKSWNEIIERMNNLPAPGSKEYEAISLNSRAMFDKLFSYETMVQNYTSYINSIDWHKR